MGTFAAPTVLVNSPTGNARTLVVSTTGSASYATGGDTLNLSSSGTGALAGGAWEGFTTVYAVKHCGTSPAASTKYLPVYVPAAAGAAATGLVKIHDTSAAADAEVSNATDLSGTTFYFEITGR